MVLEAKSYECSSCTHTLFDLFALDDVASYYSIEVFVTSAMPR